MICPPVNSENYKALISKLGPLGAFKVFLSLRKKFENFLTDDQIQGKLESMLAEVLEQDPEPLTTLAEVRAEVNKMWEFKNKLAVVAKYNSENTQKIKLVNIAEDVEGMDPLYDVEYEIPIEKLFKKVNPLVDYGITSSDMNGNAEKDIKMAQESIDSKDGQFIGFGTILVPGTVSSTNKYKEAWGNKANTGNYTSDSVIMVSASGAFGRKGMDKEVEKKEIEKTFETSYKPLLELAVKAGASFRLGNQYSKGNYGDELVAKYLKEAGYVEEKLQGYSRWVKALKGVEISSNVKGLAAALTNPTELAKSKGNLTQSYPVIFNGVSYKDVEEAYQKLKDKSESQTKPSIEKSKNYKLMVSLIKSKLEQHSRLVDEITKQGGSSWILSSTHQPTNKNTVWETGGQNWFIKALNEAYKSVSAQQEPPTTFESADLEKLNNINYVFKSSQKILENLPKIKKWENDKSISKETLWKKIGDLGFSKNQLILIKESEGSTVEEKLSSFLANYSYTVEINTATQIELGKEIKYNENSKVPYTIYFSDTGIPTRSFRTKEEAEKYMSKPSSYYSNLTVNEDFYKNNPDWEYKEQRITTPLITPSIKGHAQFAEDTDIGWFRAWYNKKTGEVHVLEVQSDLFQKGRDSNVLSKKLEIKKVGDTFISNGENFTVTNIDTDSELYELITIQDSQGRTATMRRTQLEKRFDGRGDNSSDNQFLQLLNKDNNWVTFFLKAVLQDSAKKGYKKVLFPTGNTASKIEGHSTLEEFKKQKEDRIKELEKDIIDYTKDKENASKRGDKEQVKRSDRGIETRNNEINQLKEELERIEGPEGFGALRPIYNFYENIVSRVLEKKGFNPKLITDEYGNTWNEIEIKKEQAEKALVFESALDMFTSTNPTPVQSDVLDDFYRNYTFRDTSNDESTSKSNFEKSVEQLKQIQDEYKKLYNQGNVEYAIPLKKIKNLLNEVNSRRQRLPGTKKVTWTSNDIVMLQPLITDLSEVLTKDVISKIKKDSSLLEKYRFRDSSLTSNELSDLEDLVLKYKTYLHEFSQLETLGAIITNNYNDVLKVQGAVNAEILYKDFLNTFRSFKVYNSLVNDVILIHSLNKEIDTASTSEVADSLTKAKQMVKSLLFEFDSNKLSAYFLNLSESTNPLLQLVSKLITKMKVSRASNFEAFSAKHKEKLDAFKKVTEGVENPTKMFIQKDQDGKYTKYLIDKISYEFKIKLNNLFNKVNFKNAQVDKYQVANYLKLVSNHLTVKSKPFFKRVGANMLNELTSGVISQEEYDTWYRYNSPESLQEAMNLIKAAYTADPNLSPNSLFENQSLIEAGKTIISFEGDMFYTFDMDENNPNNDQYINPQYKELMTKDQAIIDYYNFIVDYTSKFRLMMPPSFESDLFESTSIFEISKTLSEVIQDEGFVGAAALGIEDWALSLVSENSNFQDMDVDPVTGKVKLEPKKTDNTGIDIDEMSMDLTKVLNAHAAAAIIYTNALATAKEVNIIKHTLENSTVQEGGEHILKNAINQLEEIALSEIAGKEKKQEGITETKILSSKDKKKLEEYTKELASEEIKGQVLENMVPPLEAAIDIHKQNSYPVSKEASFKEYLQEILTKAKLVGLDLSFLKVNVLLPSTLATNVTLEDISNASDSDIAAILNSATANLRLMNTLKYLSETVLPQEIRKNESLQKKLNYKIKGRGKFLSWDAMLSSWMSWTRKVGLSFRLSTITADLVMNFSGAMKEAVAKTYFDVKTLTNAYRIAFKETVSSAVKEDGKLIRFRNKLGLNDNIRKPNEYFTKGLEKYKDKEYALFLNQLVGDVSENAIMIAVLKSQKIKVLDSNNVEVETNIWDCFNDKGEWLYPNSKNPLEFDLAKDNSEYVEFVTSVSGKVKQAVYKITGMSKDAVAYNRDTFSRLLMMFKSWLPQAVYSRLGEEKPNLITGKLERGMYRTIFDRNGLLRDEKGNFDAQRFYTNLMYFGSLGYTKGSLREHDLANLRRLRVEAAMISLLLGAFYGLSALVSGGGGDDDEEISSINRSLLNIINKIYKDASAFYDSESLISTFGVYQVAPIAMLGKIGKAVGHVAYTITGFKGFDGKYNPIYTTGDLKGAYKARRKVVNLIPIASGIQSNIENATMDKTAKRTY